MLFARRGALEDVGLFDERYFAYCEEADLGLRAVAAGWEVGLVRGRLDAGLRCSLLCSLCHRCPCDRAIYRIARM